MVGKHESITTQKPTPPPLSMTSKPSKPPSSGSSSSSSTKPSYQRLLTTDPPPPLPPPTSSATSSLFSKQSILTLLSPCLLFLSKNRRIFIPIFGIILFIILFIQISPVSDPSRHEWGAEKKEDLERWRMAEWMENDDLMYRRPFLPSTKQVLVETNTSQPFTLWYLETLTSTSYYKFFIESLSTTHHFYARLIGSTIQPILISRENLELMRHGQKTAVYSFELQNVPAGRYLLDIYLEHDKPEEAFPVFPYKVNGRLHSKLVKFPVQAPSALSSSWWGEKDFVKDVVDSNTQLPRLTVYGMSNDDSDSENDKTLRECTAQDIKTIGDGEWVYKPQQLKSLCSSLSTSSDTLIKEVCETDWIWKPKTCAITPKPLSTTRAYFDTHPDHTLLLLGDSHTRKWVEALNDTTTPPTQNRPKLLTDLSYEGGYEIKYIFNDAIIYFGFKGLRPNVWPRPDAYFDSPTPQPLDKTNRKDAQLMASNIGKIMDTLGGVKSGKQKITIVLNSGHWDLRDFTMQEYCSFLEEFIGFIMATVETKLKAYSNLEVNIIWRNLFVPPTDLRDWRGREYRTYPKFLQTTKQLQSGQCSPSLFKTYYKELRIQFYDSFGISHAVADTCCDGKHFLCGGTRFDGLGIGSGLLDVVFDKKDVLGKSVSIPRWMKVATGWWEFSGLFNSILQSS